MTIYYTAIYSNVTFNSLCESSSTNIGNVPNVTRILTRELIQAISDNTNNNPIYNIISSLAVSSDSSEGKQENITIANTTTNKNRNTNTNTRSNIENELKSKCTIIYDSHYLYHLIEDYDGLSIITLCDNNDRDRLFYFAFLIDLRLRFKTTFASRIKESLVSSGASNYIDFSTIIDKQMLIFNSPGSVTISNIIISNRKLDLLNTLTFDHQQKKHLEINFYENTSSNDLNDSLLVLKNKQFKRLVIIISIAIAIIAIIIVAIIILN